EIALVESIESMARAHNAEAGHESRDLMLLVGQRAEVAVTHAEVDGQRLRHLPVIVHKPVERILRVVALQKAAGDADAGSGTDYGRAAGVGGISGQEIQEGFLLRGVSGAGGPGSAGAIEGEGAARVRLIEDV